MFRVKTDHKQRNVLLSSLWLSSATSLTSESTDQIILFLKTRGEILVQSQHRILLEASLVLNKYLLSVMSRNWT